MNFAEKLKNLVCYCGLTKDEYNSIKLDAYVSNFKIWKWLHIIVIIICGSVLIESLIVGDYPILIGLRIFNTAYAAVVTILFFKVFKPESIVPQLCIYLTMILTLASEGIVGLQQPDQKAVSFVVMMVIIAMFMIDKPYFMGILLAVAAAAYMILATIFKTGEALEADLVNVAAFALFSIFANMFYNMLRVKEFITDKREKQLVAEKQEELIKNQELSSTLGKMSESLIEVFGDIVESRDSDSGEHVQRVKGYTYILAKRVMEDLPEYGLDDHQVGLITYTSAVHDVGKIFIPDAVLLKPGRLTSEEFEIMKTHSARGCDVLKKMEGKWSKEYLDMGMDICLNHHEKWDGKGYPNGLKGDMIPIAAQIVSLADIYDALTTKRVYKDAYTLDEAFEMILNGECGVFSNKLMNCFKACKADFEKYAVEPESLEKKEYKFEVAKDEFGNAIVGMQKQDEDDRKRNAAAKAVVAVMPSRYYFVGYLDSATDEIIKLSIDDEIEGLITGFGTEYSSGDLFDKVLNSIIVIDDYGDFRRATERSTLSKEVKKNGRAEIEFRVKLSDGVHYCKFKLIPALNNLNNFVIFAEKWDQGHKLENESMRFNKNRMIMEGKL